MKYISLEDLEKARLNRVCSSEHLTEYAAGQLDGWNKCIDALKELGRESTYIFGEVFGDAMHTIFDPVFKKQINQPTITATADDLDADFLEALAGSHAEPGDDPEEYPDCEECRFSGLLTDD